MSPHTLFMCADGEVPRALGGEQDYAQLRTAAQDRMAEKRADLQADLHAVMLRKAASEEVDLSALVAMGARLQIRTIESVTCMCWLVCAHFVTLVWLQGLRCNQQRRQLQNSGRGAASSSSMPVQRRLLPTHRPGYR